MTLRASLNEQIAQIRLVDTHEHLQLGTAESDRGLWKLFGGTYVYVDFLLAGAPADLFSTRPASAEEEFTALEPYLDLVAATGYFRAVWEALRLVFAVQQREVDRALYLDLDRRVREAQADPTWGKRLLREVAGLDRALLDTFWDPVAAAKADRELFDPVLRVNAFVMCPWEGQRDHNSNSLWDHQEPLGVTVRRFADYLDLFEALLERYVALGVKALKLALAYDRDLDFQPVERAEAERIWSQGLSAAPPAAARALQDYLVYHAVGQAGERGLPVQIHTGILEGLRSYRPTDVRPSLLVPLITAHPEVRFDLFHAGFPYARELGVMGMNFPNVWADLCWVPLISPAAAAQILVEWIDMLPANKLLWGGDCGNAVAALGACLLGRQAVAEALARQIEARACTEAQALRLAERILRDNALALFYGGELPRAHCGESDHGAI